MTSTRRQRGFSLIGVPVAIAVIATAVGVLTHLVVLATRANVAATAVTLATMLAAERADRLSGDLSVPGAVASLSPADALEMNATGFSDFFDARGRPLGAGPALPDGTRLVRRWSVASIPAGPPDARVLRVVVLPWPDGAGRDVSAELARVVLVVAEDR